MAGVLNIARLAADPSAPSAGAGAVYLKGASDAAMLAYLQRPDATVLTLATLEGAQTFTGALTLTAASPQLTLGVLNTTSGGIKFFGSTSGNVTLAPNVAAGASVTVTLPAVTDTLATLSGTEELDNKTLDSSVGKGTWTASGTWTLPALTLGGTVSGGGNQLNNVIIGTTTPLAGSFTTGNFSDTVLMHKNTNGPARFTSRNDTSDTAAQAQLGAQMSNFTSYVLMGVASAAFTPSGLTAASCSYVVSSGQSAGLRIFTDDATQLILGTNNTANLTIASGGAATFSSATINMTTSGTTLTVGVGADNGTVSAGVFTDRTKHFDGDALAEIKKIKGKNGHIDHDSLPAFARANVRKQSTDSDGKVTETIAVERDLGAMISIIAKGMQEVDSRLTKLEARQ